MAGFVDIFRRAKGWWSSAVVAPFVPQVYTASLYCNITPTTAQDGNVTPAISSAANPTPTTEAKSG